MKKTIYGLAWIVALTGCVTVISPGKSPMFNVQGGEFEISGKQSDKLDYFVVLNVKKPDNKTYYLTAGFEDPCNHNNEIMSDVTLGSKEKKVLLRSPALDCVKASRYYRVTVKTYDDQAKTHLVDRLTHKVYSLMDSTKLMLDSGK